MIKRIPEEGGPVSQIDRDWNAEWMRLGATWEHFQDPSYWDKRADDFAAATRGRSPYVSDFLECMRILPGESVLDMGSGSGTLALPLARAGHSVCAVDFSERMLAVLERHAGEEGLGNLTTVQASWEDDWRALGVGLADVAVASRSISVNDLQAALQKLDAFARRRVCVTLPADGLFYPDLVARAAVGRTPEKRGSHIYAVNMLYQMGILAEVRFVRHESNRRFGSLEHARESLRRMIGPVDDREEKLIERYLAEHLIETTDGAGRTVWTQDQSFSVRWAFVAWDKDDAGA